ncbi:hypothetical protein ACHAXR_007486 [Thalassiosira sp. AJA248-18]
MAAAASLLLIVGAASLYMSSNSLIDTPHNNNQRRDLSVALPGGGCKVTVAKLSPTPIAPTWQASFPGSGARMTWILVEALTGIRTNNDYDSQERGYENVVVVKTHYPVKNAKHKFAELDPLFGRAMVILRNPINAIPSYFNQMYEQVNHLPTHSTRGPNKDWIKCRDDSKEGLAFQLGHYERFVEYWMERYPERRDLLMVSYEDLTDTNLGPLVTMRIADFVAETEGVNPIAPESVPCVWETVVNYKNDGPPPDHVPEVDARRKNRNLEGNNNDKLVNVDEKQDAMRRLRVAKDPSSLRTGPKNRPYTKQNLVDMEAMLQRLMEKYSYDEDLVKILVSYIEVVSNTEPQD